MASAETSVSAKTGSAGGPQKTKIGLVLQGGGALGAYEAGAVKCLYDSGMECTIVAGASSGALNAVTLAAAKNPPVELEAMWKGFKTPDILVPPPAGPVEHVAAVGVPHMYRPRLDYWRLLTWTYAADNTPLKETLERLDWDQVRDPDHMRVFVSASDIENGKTVYFSNLYPKRKLPGPEYPAVHFGVEHAMASGSFPGGFPWTVIDGRSYWDGGLTDNTPLHPVIDNLTTAEAETMPIYVIDVNTGAGYDPGQPSASGAAGVRDAPAEQPGNRYAQSREVRAIHQPPEGGKYNTGTEGGKENTGRGEEAVLSARRARRSPGRAPGSKRHGGLGRSHDIRPCPERACGRHHETGRGEPRRFHWGGDRAAPRLWIQANARVPRLAATCYIWLGDDEPAEEHATSSSPITPS